MDIMTTYTGETYPEVITEKVRNKTLKYVPYNITKDTEGMYSWEYIPVSLEYYNYSGLVDVFIGLKYSLSQMIAIMNNYMFEPDRNKYREEFLEMQNWRNKAKELAKTFFPNND